LTSRDAIKRRIAQLEASIATLTRLSARWPRQTAMNQIITARMKKSKLLLRRRVAELIDQTVPTSRVKRRP